MLLLKQVEIIARLCCFLAVWVVKKEILERSFGVASGCHVFCARSRGVEPDVTDLVLRIYRDRFVRKLVHHSLVRFNGRIVRTLLLPREANIKLRARCVLSVRCRPNDRRKNGHGAFERGRDRDAEDPQLFAR